MIEERLREKIDGKVKPWGSLGKLEELALQIGKVQNSLSPELKDPTLLVFAGDHGAERSGVSAYPRSVTHRMVENILQGGAAISSFARLHGLSLYVVDSGVDRDLNEDPSLIDAKVGKGTQDHSKEVAISHKEFQSCEKAAEEVVVELARKGSNVLGFGEMGIGNSAAASAIMCRLTGLSIEECVGMGAGSVGEAFEKKKQVIGKALDLHRSAKAPDEVLKAFGGYEIAQMQAAMLSAHKRGMLLLVDGFISTTALYAAWSKDPSILESTVFSHVSEEAGHSRLLEDLGADPLLRLGMRLGEGTGAALAYPIVRSAVAFLNEMASFESLGLEEKKGNLDGA